MDGSIIWNDALSIMLTNNTIASAIKTGLVVGDEKNNMLQKSFNSPNLRKEIRRSKLSLTFFSTTPRIWIDRDHLPLANPNIIVGTYWKNSISLSFSLAVYYDLFLYKKKATIISNAGPSKWNISYKHTTYWQVLYRLRVFFCTLKL